MFPLIGNFGFVTSEPPKKDFKYLKSDDQIEIRQNFGQTSFTPYCDFRLQNFEKQFFAKVSL